MTVPLTKVDSAIAGLSIEDNKPPVSEEKEAKKTHKRTSSQGENVWNILDLGMSILQLHLIALYSPYSPEAKKIELELPIETQKTGW